MAVPSFTDPVPDNGYRWWYLDAISDDDQHALTVIVFIGSVFSPYYARARKRGNTAAGEHCSVNVALYGAPWRWCMTERTAASMRASGRARKQQMSLGRSQIQFDNNCLRVSIDEISVPLPTRIRGELEISLPTFELNRFALDTVSSADAQHFWQPIAPQAPIEVNFATPGLNWKGKAYVDSNYGSAPLESSFKSWVWSRSHAPDGSTSILYDVVDKQGNSRRKTLRFDVDGRQSEHVAEHIQNLSSTRYWRVPRQVRTPHETRIFDVQTLEDTPFYSRSRFKETTGDKTFATVHESLYLDRFDTPWVRCLLPFRMPRRTRPVLLEKRINV